MRLSTAFTLAFTALLVTSTLGAVAAAPSMSSSAADDRPSSPAHDQSSAQHLSPTNSQNTGLHYEESDPKQVLNINITGTGDAEWTVESRFVLADDDEAEQFMEFATDRTSSGDYPITAFDAARETAETSLDREMSIEDDRWDDPRTEAPNDDELEAIEDDDDLDVEDAKVGVISYSFTWTNFGQVDDDRLYVADVFESEHGNLLPFLNSDQRLVIQVPQGYEGATPGGDDGAYVWDGPVELDDEPDLVFLSSGSSSGGFALGWVEAGFLLFALAFGVGGYLLARRRSDLEKVSEHLPAVSLPGITNDEESNAGASAEAGSFEASGPVPPAGAGPASGSPRDAELAFDEAEDVDPSLLSDEERVHRMLSKNGGRMKQATIVKETGWSNAKVSQLLSKMDDDEEIEKLRIGRENLITHPEVDPTEID